MSFKRLTQIVNPLAAATCALAVFLMTPLLAQDQAANSAAPTTPSTQPAEQKSVEPRTGGYGDDILNNPTAHKSETTVSTVSESTTDPDVEPKREPSATEILRELLKHGDAPRPVILPVTPGQRRQVVVDPAAMPANAVAQVVPKLYPDGYRIVDRPGRLTREGDYYTFSFETRTEGPVEIPIRLLPNRLLEDMEIASAGGTKPIVFIISGEMTTYHGVNYLLVQKLLTRSFIGNLK